MPTSNPIQQFVILPPRGLVAAGATAASVKHFFTTLESTRGSSPTATARAMRKKTKMKVLDSIHENGPKLVEMHEDDISTLRAEQPGVRVVPVVTYETARAPRQELASGPKLAATVMSAAGISIKVVSAADGVTPVAGVSVTAFTDFESRAGADGKTNKQGIVTLSLEGASKKIERLYLYAEFGYWSGLLKNVTVKNGIKVPLRPIELPFNDSLRFFNKPKNLKDGNGITVGVIDTGVGPHNDLAVSGGENTVLGEDPKDWQDNGEGHGTHVAGIIAARGQAPNGVMGVAPGVVLRSYRVFGKGAKTATNFAISKALDHAVADGCDLINMSLGGGASDEATHSAIVDARAAGVLVFISTGNDGRSPVSFPGSDSMALAVSALGRKGTFPPDAVEVGDVMAPYGTDKKNFIAAFSNIGPEVDLTAAGVGVISTFPKNRLAVMDGTSMACPAATGAAARLLGGMPALLKMTRNQARSDAMLKAVLSGAKGLGFAGKFEGAGLLK